MNSFEYLVNHFDFRRKPDECNIPECSEKAKKIFILEEFNLKLHRKKGIAEIKLCSEHLSKINPIIRELNENFAKDFKVIRFSEKKI